RAWMGWKVEKGGEIRNFFKSIPDSAAPGPSARAMGLRQPQGGSEHGRIGRLDRGAVGGAWGRDLSTNAGNNVRIWRDGGLVAKKIPDPFEIPWLQKRF